MEDEPVLNAGQFLPFALPDISDEEISEVVDAIKSGWVTTGPRAKRFEEDFAQFIGEGVEAVAVNSATAGLHLALEAAGIGSGDAVAKALAKSVLDNPQDISKADEVRRKILMELDK